MIYLRFGVIFLVIFINYMRCDVDMMVRYVCAVTEKIVNADQDINDVAIGNFNTKMPAEFLSEVTKCISRHTMVVTTDFSKKISDKNLRKAQVVIIVSDESNQVIFILLIK